MNCGSRADEPAFAGLQSLPLSYEGATFTAESRTAARTAPDPGSGAPPGSDGASPYPPRSSTYHNPAEIAANLRMN
jgi:hypothetical protein